MHHELAIMVKYGLTPQEALLCSIVNGPAFFNQSAEYGSVALNKKADLLILNKNPLEKIENTQTIDGIIRKGDYLNRHQLDTILLELELKVKQLK